MFQNEVASGKSVQETTVMSEIVSTEIVFGRGDEGIIKDCHRIRTDVFHIEQARNLFLVPNDSNCTDY
jgi:hypothetical protein